MVDERGSHSATEAEEHATTYRASGETAASTGKKDQCPVCWGLLCDPVAWPGCSHHFCLGCSYRLRSRRSQPCCPLCRSSAGRCLEASDLSVDDARASQVRDSVGESVYEKHRKQIQEQLQIPSRKQLGTLPLLSFCGSGLSFEAGGPSMRLTLALQNESQRTALERSVQADGRRRLALVPRSPSMGLEVGAVCRICDVISSVKDSQGNVHVLLETADSARVAGLSWFPILEATLEEWQDDGASDDNLDQPVVSEADLHQDEPPEHLEVLGRLEQELESVRRRRSAAEAVRQAFEEVTNDSGLRSTLRGSRLSPTPTSSSTNNGSKNNNNNNSNNNNNNNSSRSSSSSSSSSNRRGQGGPRTNSNSAAEQLTPGASRDIQEEDSGVAVMHRFLQSYRNSITVMDRLLEDAFHTLRSGPVDEEKFGSKSEFEPPQQHDRDDETDDDGDERTLQTPPLGRCSEVSTFSPVSSRRRSSESPALGASTSRTAMPPQPTPQPGLWLWLWPIDAESAHEPGQPRGRGSEERATELPSHLPGPGGPSGGLGPGAGSERVVEAGD